MPPTATPLPCTGCPHCRDEIAALVRAARETQRWSAFGSAAGTAVVLTLWHLFAYLTRMQ
jgi:hypothetical protein